MAAYLTLLSVLVLQMAACRPRPVTSHVSSTRSCPVCRGVRGPKASSLRPSLAAGEPCGVYTPSCVQGFKCTPVEDDPRPLQALLEGRGVCITATAAARISPTKRIHTVGPTRSEAPQKAPCHRLLVEIVKGLDSQLFQSHHDIYMPNCDRHGFFIQKQCRSSRRMQRGSCWCVDENGKQAVSHTKHDGTLVCDTS